MSHHDQTRPLRYGSLFSGIDGIGLAFDRCGAVCAFQVEKLAHLRDGPLAAHWPDAPKFDDVATVTKETLGDAGTGIDVLVGGFPCQDISVAGGRRGLAGERSFLWWHFARLVAELAPRWVLVENVDGLLSSNGGGDMGAVLGALGDLGYGFAYRVLDAQWFGVAQRRKRVVIVGCAGHWTGAAEVLLEPETGGGHPREVNEKEARAALRAGRRPRTSRRARAGSAVAEDVVSPLLAPPDGSGYRFGVEDAAGGQLVIADAVPLALRGRDGDALLESGEEGDPMYALRAGDGSSSRAPLVGVFRKSKRASTDTDDETWVEDDVANTLTDFDTGGTRATAAIVEAIPIDSRNAGRTGPNGVGTPGVGVGDDGDPSFTLTGGAPVAVAYAVTPERGQGADLVVTETDVSQTLTHNALGRGSERQAIILQSPASQSERVITGDVAPTLTASDSPNRGGSEGPLVLLGTELVVRRLLPVECLRLQGFPDDWCGDHDGSWQRPDGLSDSKVYAAAGNSVAVPMFQWIARRLVKFHHAAGLDTIDPPAPQPFEMPEFIEVTEAEQAELDALADAAAAPPPSLF